MPSCLRLSLQPARRRRGGGSTAVEVFSGQLLPGLICIAGGISLGALNLSLQHQQQPAPPPASAGWRSLRSLAGGVPARWPAPQTKGDQIEQEVRALPSCVPAVTNPHPAGPAPTGDTPSPCLCSPLTCHYPPYQQLARIEVEWRAEADGDLAAWDARWALRRKTLPELRAMGG